MLLTDLVSTALGPQFTVERELTGGGMARVVVAHDRQLDRRVVVKILPPELAATVSLERFRREILLIAGLQHPNVVPVLTAGEVEGLPYLVMPFVDGESLRARLARGPLRVVEAVSILRDVARALAYAHERGVVHRDVKPDNVLLSARAAVVADFGVARALAWSRREAVSGPRGTITAAGTTLGTPDYMAPEQIAADPDADHRVDLYALGAMAYEMVTGAPPFGGRRPQALLAAHLAEAPKPLAESGVELPEAFCRLVMSCLEKEPAKRPQSAHAVLQALDDPAVVSGAFATPGALPAELAPLVAARRRRRRLTIAGGAAAAALLAVGAWAALDGPAAAPEGRAGAPAAAAAPAVAGPPSLAVLPLALVDSDSSFAYLASGLTSELTNAAARVPGLRVLSVDAARRLQQRVVEGGDAAGTVTMLLEGAVQRQGDRFHIDVRVVGTADDFTLWADSYEGTVGDRFAVQRAIADAVTATLRQEVAAKTGAGRDTTP